MPRPARVIEDPAPWEERPIRYWQGYLEEC